MGEILDRTGRIIKRRFFPPRAPIPFNPSLDQLNDARDTLQDLRRIGAVSDFAATGLKQIIDKAKVSDPNIDVGLLIGIGSERIENLYRVVTSPVQDAHLEINDRAEVEYALDLAKRAEAQAARPRTQPIVDSGSRTVSRRGVLLGLGGAAGVGLLALLSANLPQPVQKVAIKPTLLASELASEQDIWKRALGADVGIEPLPPSVTPEVKRNLEAFGFELMYLPKLEIRGSDELQKKYPNLKQLDMWFWSRVRDGSIDSPRLSGQWIAAEQISLESTLSARLGRPRSRSWEKAKASIVREKGGILSDIGLREGGILDTIGVRSGAASLSMPEALEWSLIRSRNIQGANPPYEWTSTIVRYYNPAMATTHLTPYVDGMRPGWLYDEHEFRLVIHI